jgi:hypothetical protein
VERRRLVLASALVLLLGLSLTVLSIWNFLWDRDYPEVSIPDLWANKRDFDGKIVRTGGIVKYYDLTGRTDTTIGDFYIIPITSRYLPDNSPPQFPLIPIFNENEQPLPTEGSYVEVYGEFVRAHMEGLDIHIEATSWHYTSVAYDFIKVVMLFSGVALMFLPFYVLGRLLGWRRILHRKGDTAEFPSGD